MAETVVIKAIKEKVEKLISDNRRLTEANSKVTLQRDKLKADNRQLTEQMAMLEKRIAVLELKGAVAGDSDEAKLARARVNRLMREVDKCIALLNR